MKKGILSITLALLLTFSFAFSSIAHASDSLPLYYNMTLKKSYPAPMSNQDIDNAIAEIKSGNKFAKNVGPKLVDYDDYKSKINEVFFQGLELNLDDDEIIMMIIEALPSIIDELPSIPVENPDDGIDPEPEPETFRVIDIY